MSCHCHDHSCCALDEHSHDEHEEHEHEGSKSEIVELAIGGALFLAAFLLEKVFDARFIYVLLASIAAYIALGREVILASLRNIKEGDWLDENFLMSIATIGAFAIGESIEAAAVMLFYRVGEYFQELAVSRSQKSIRSLMDIRPDTALLVTDEGAAETDARGVHIGDTILVRAGDRVPLDGVVTDGESTLDTSALTGEALPREVREGGEVLSGSVNLSGTLTLRVTKEFGDSAASRIIEMVKNASSRKAPTEKMITRFAKVYTPIVVALALIIAVVPPIILGGWQSWIHRALVFLVISCPCALVLSVPLAFFAGIGGASRRGILIRSGSALQTLAKADTVVFDKTGTLTYGRLTVSKINPAGVHTEEELLYYTAHAEAFSTHPIAKAIISAYGKDMDAEAVGDSKTAAGFGVTAIVNAKTVLAGSAAHLRKNGVEFDEIRAEGSIVYTAADGEYLGSIVISDEVKKDSRNALAALKALGVRKTVMLSGDNEASAKHIGGLVGIDEVRANLLPEDKVSAVERLMDTGRNASRSPDSRDLRPRAGNGKHGSVVFVGDGINDAPALARADIGVAMGGLGSDAAIESADIVLMTDEPTKLAEAVTLSRRVMRVARQNIAFALAVKAAFMLLGFMGIFTMWEAVFADVGVALLAVLNSMRLLRGSSTSQP